MNWSWGLREKKTRPLTWERYDELVENWWKNFNDYWSKVSWSPSPWLPMHDFPYTPLELGVPTSFKCNYCGTKSEVMTKLSDIITRHEGVPFPFVCTRPDPRML